MPAFADLEFVPDRAWFAQNFDASFEDPEEDGGDLDRPERVRHLNAISKTIEDEIIPRLLLAHTRADASTNGAVASRAPAPARTIEDSDVVYFCELILTVGPHECILHAEMLRSQGVAQEALFLDLFAASARRLGEMWTDDIRSFTDVTIGLGTLQQVFRAFSPGFETGSTDMVNRQALLLPAPGEQHTFGLFMVESFLHRAGWRVAAMPDFDPLEVRGFLKQHDVDLVGITASCDRFIDPTERAISFVRDLVAQPDLMVMVGGKPFNETPGLVAEVGADATAKDARSAADVAGRLIPPATRGRVNTGR